MINKTVMSQKRQVFVIPKRRTADKPKPANPFDSSPSLHRKKTKAQVSQSHSKALQYVYCSSLESLPTLAHMYREHVEPNLDDDLYAQTGRADEGSIEGSEEGSGDSEEDEGEVEDNKEASEGEEDNSEDDEDDDDKDDEDDKESEEEDGTGGEEDMRGNGNDPVTGDGDSSSNESGQPRQRKRKVGPCPLTIHIPTDMMQRASHVQISGKSSRSGRQVRGSKKQKQLGKPLQRVKIPYLHHEISRGCRH